MNIATLELRIKEYRAREDELVARFGDCGRSHQNDNPDCSKRAAQHSLLPNWLAGPF